MFRRRKAENDVQDNSHTRPSPLGDAGDGMWYKKPSGSTHGTNTRGNSSSSIDETGDLKQVQGLGPQQYSQHPPLHVQHVHVGVGVGTGTGRHPPAIPSNFRDHREQMGRIPVGTTTTTTTTTTDLHHVPLRQHPYEYATPTMAPVAPAPLQTRTVNPHQHPRYLQNSHLHQHHEQPPLQNHHHHHHHHQQQYPLQQHPRQTPKPNPGPILAGTPAAHTIVTKNISLVSILSRHDWTLALKKLDDDPECAVRKENVTLQGQVTVSTPLSLAVSLGATAKVVKKLLGANPNAAGIGDDTCGRMPLHWACISGAPPSVLLQLLDANMKSAKTVDRTHGRLPLHYAVIYATTLDQVRVVLNAEKRAVTLKDSQGKTPIALVMESPCLLKMEILDELNTVAMAVANKKNGKTSKSGSDPKQQQQQVQHILGSSGHHRQQHDLRRGEISANHPLRQPSPPRQQQIANNLNIPNRKAHGEKQKSNGDFEGRRSPDRHNSGCGGGRPPAVHQRRGSSGGSRPPSPSVTALSAPEIMGLEFDLSTIAHHSKQRPMHTTRPPSHPVIMDDLGIEKMYSPTKQYSPSKKGPRGIEKPPSTGGFFLEPTLIATPHEKSLASKSRICQDQGPMYMSDDEIEYEGASPLPQPAGRRQQTWSPSAMKGPQQHREEPHLTVAQDALRQHAYDFKAAAGGGPGVADPMRTPNSESQAKERASHGHTTQHQPPRGNYAGSHPSDGPSNPGVSPAGNQYHQYQHLRATKHQEVDPYYGASSGYQSPLAIPISTTPDDERWNPTSAPPSASNLKSPPPSSISQTSDIDRQNPKSSPPNASNLKPAPPSSNSQTSSQKEHLKSPPPTGIPNTGNLKPPPPDSNASNLKQPPPTAVSNTTNLKLPPPTAIPNTAKLKSPPQDSNASNLKPPPPNIIPNTSNLKPPPPDSTAINDKQQSLELAAQLRGANVDPAIASGENLRCIPNFDADTYTRKMIEYSSNPGNSKGVIARSSGASRDMKGPADLVGQIMLDDMNTDMKSIEDKLAGRRKVLQEKNSQLSSVDSQLSEMGAKKESLDRDWETARASYEQQQTALGHRRIRVSQLSAQIKALEEELERERSGLEHMEASVRAHEKSATRAEQELLGTRDEFGSLGVIRQALEDETSFLHREVANFESELKSLHALRDMAAGGGGGASLKH